MSNTDTSEDLYWNLLQISFRAKHGLMRLAETYNLNVMQLYALCTMEISQPIPMNFISGLLVCDASTVTGIIDHLFSAGLILRKENPTDRRTKLVALTKKGDATKHKILDELRIHELDTLRQLSDTQKKELQGIAAAALRQL